MVGCGMLKEACDVIKNSYIKGLNWLKSVSVEEDAEVSGRINKSSWKTANILSLPLQNSYKMGQQITKHRTHTRVAARLQCWTENAKGRGKRTGAHMRAFSYVFRTNRVKKISLKPEKEESAGFDKNTIKNQPKSSGVLRFFCCVSIPDDYLDSTHIEEIISTSYESINQDEVNDVVDAVQCSQHHQRSTGFTQGEYDTSLSSEDEGSLHFVQALVHADAVDADEISDLLSDTSVSSEEDVEASAHVSSDDTYDVYSVGSFLDRLEDHEHLAGKTSNESFIRNSMDSLLDIEVIPA